MKSSKKASAVFKDIVPGKYQVSAQKEDWCWAQNLVAAEVNIDNIEVELVQSGYLLTVTSSHATLLSYTVTHVGKTKTGSVQVQKGTTKTCLSDPGVYTFKAEGCHKFASSTYKWNTAQPSLLSLVASHHTISATIKSSEPGTFMLQVNTASDGSSTELKPIKKTSSGNEYRFSHIIKENEMVTFIPKSSDNLFQYEPASHSFTVPADCVADVVTFSAEKALFIDGKITPPVEGVQITVQVVGSDEKHTFVTDKKGTYKAGPLDNSLKYNISASLTSYTLKPLDSHGNFEAFKLAEVIVEILDESSKKPLTGVVVSMSGGKSYRQNSLTGEDGTIAFHSLLPGEYFLRSAMKEYNFQPPTKMVTVEQGATIRIKVR